MTGVLTCQARLNKLKFPQMDNILVEAQYPLDFRKDDALVLGSHIKNRHNVVLIGMRRVGISSFLRFFLYHKSIPETYIKDSKSHLLIPVDLNDLVERELFPFWILTLKRIWDMVEKSLLSKEIKKYIGTLFLDGIQYKDLFLLTESVRKALVKIVESGIIPTLFFIRFDRIKEAVTPEFFDNLEGLREATHHKLAFCFTSYRTLDKLSPTVFLRASLASFSNDIYIKPANQNDMKVIFNSYKQIYKLELPEKLEKDLFDLVDGYNQYLQLALIHLHEHNGKKQPEINLFEELTKDERVNLQSEELWESLTSSEQAILVKADQGLNLSEAEKDEAKYLFETGFLTNKDSGLRVFSPLFSYYLKQNGKKTQSESVVEFSKKEHALFNFLKQNLDGVCERERIIESVWPEQDALGVSDWAIDRLIARLRNKLKQQKSSLEIITIKTRGYKMISNG